MLQVLASFINYVTDYRGWDKCEPDWNHENDEDTVRLLLKLFQIVSHWERWCGNLELEIWVTSGLLQNRLVHELRVQRRYILRGDIQKCAELELLRFIIGLIDEVRAVPVRLLFPVKPRFKHIIVKFSQQSPLTCKGFSVDIRIVFVGHIESSFKRWEGFNQCFRLYIICGSPHQPLIN